jgi:hypothetical protein
MTNTRQISRYRGSDLGETAMMNHDLVRDHIDDLFREGDALRAERREAEHRPVTDHLANSRAGALRPARVRFGRWLVGVGWAVAGCPDESAGTVGRAV